MGVLIKKMKRSAELRKKGIETKKDVRESGFETPKNDLSSYSYTRCMVMKYLFRTCLQKKR